MKKPIRGLIAACIIAIVVLGMGYVGLAMYYQNGFLVNTWINGVYCTGSSVQEVNEQLLEQTDLPKTLTVIGYEKTGEDCEEVSWVIPMEDLQYTIDYEVNLNAYLASQNPWMWIDNVASRQKHTVAPNISYNEVVLLEWMEQMTPSLDSEADYRIDYSEETGYMIYDGLHNRVDKQKVFESVQRAVLARAETVSLIECGCYYDIPLDEKQQEDAELWKQIKNFQDKGPVYDFGDEKVRMDSAYMAKCLVKNSSTQMPIMDENNHFLLEEDCGADWVLAMAEKYDTYGKVWEFESTRGETVSVEGENYGSTINQEREVLWLNAYLKDLADKKISPDNPLQEGSEYVPRIPEYTRSAYNRGDSLGDTYVEVDMGIQKLYYYEDGELLLETDIVSGNARRRWNTPEGVNYVYNKQKNRVLRGEGYATPVKFWMPVDGAIGIHDADWRDEFGGDIYKTDGSHGCMNIPKEVMPTLYEMVEIGTPVIMFYGSDPYATDAS